jgi:hypothetical protein
MATASLEMIFAPAGVARSRIAALFAVLFSCTSIAGYAYRRPHAPQVPLALSLRETAGQLRIHWSRAAADQGATLEILDGPHRTTVLVNSPLFTVTYAAQTDDVRVRLTSGGANGEAEVTHSLVSSPSLAILDWQFATLEAAANSLQSAIRAQDLRLAALESAAQGLRAAGP